MAKVHNIVKQVANKTIPKKKKSTKAKWLSEKALQVAEERREVKSKGEREKHIQLNAEFQKKAGRDKKAFINEQCLVIKENNKRGKTRDLFRKIENLRGAFCPKMGTIKGQNGRDLVDAEEIKKRWKEYTKELCKKDLNDPNYYDGMVSYPKPDIVECKLKWALRNTAINKASACDEIPAEQFRSLKNNAIKVLHSLCQQIWKTQQWPQDWKMSILIPVPKKGSTKECANHWIVAFISHASKVMLKILHARFQHYVN